MGDFGTEICCCHSLSEERWNKEQEKGSSNRGRHVALKNKSQKMEQQLKTAFGKTQRWAHTR